MNLPLLTAALYLTLGAVPAAAQSGCSEGCSPRYWVNHKERWDALGTNDFTQSVKWFQSFNLVFGVTQGQSGVSNGEDLIEAADRSGGGLTALNRHAATALANADSLCFDLTVGQVIDLYRDAVGAAPGPATISSATATLTAFNLRTCPLSQNPPPPPLQIFCVADQGDCPCGTGSLIAGCRNSSGLGARLDAQGTTSVTADDLEAVATQLPANTAVLFLMADSSRRAPFLDGLLCIGGPMSKIFRIPPPFNSGPNGTATRSGGLVALSNSPLLPVPGGIRSGETWYFQTYFRDTQGCGGGANTSNVVGLTFVP